MKNEIKQELIGHIIPFWDSLTDNQNGGFYGYVGYDLGVDKNASKNAVIHSRILWFYANCCLVLKDKRYLKQAGHCYDFIMKHFFDREKEGVYWSVKADGSPDNPMKHVYAQSFMIYALASYYDASGDSAALDTAMELFKLIETLTADKIAYRECFDRDWNPADNHEMSENGIKAEKSMNVVLHLIEAYTELYRVGRDSRVAEKLKDLLALTYDKIYDGSKRQLSVFFDNDMNVLGNIHSYGHDIEASWLIGRALDIAKDAIPLELTQDIRRMNRDLVERIDVVAFCEDESGGLYYESDGGRVNKKRVWWAQSEGFVGFLNAYRLYGEKRYLDRADRLWGYIKAHVIDRREGGEWYNELDKHDTPVKSLPVVDEWKCPYHNGRMALMALELL